MCVLDKIERDISSKNRHNNGRNKGQREKGSTSKMEKVDMEFRFFICYDVKQSK